MNTEEKLLWLFIVGLIMMYLFVEETPKHYYIAEEVKEEVVEHSLQAEIKEEEQPKKDDWNVTVTVTVYNPVEGQCDSSPLITADNSKIDLQKLEQGKLKWVAVSRDLLKTVKYGGRIRLNCKDPKLSGIYYVHDTMNPRWKKRVDILMPPSVKTGMQHNVKLEYLD